MPHIIDYNPATQTIEIKVHGTIVLNQVIEVYTELARLAKEKNCLLFLIDFTEATISLSTMEIHDLPKTLADIFAPSGIPANKLRRAYVVSNSLEDFRFFENVTLNRGQNTKIFRDLTEAKEWLYANKRG
jgi:hypothetical protein